MIDGRTSGYIGTARDELLPGSRGAFWLTIASVKVFRGKKAISYFFYVVCPVLQSRKCLQFFVSEIFIGAITYIHTYVRTSVTAQCLPSFLGKLL